MGVGVLAQQGGDMGVEGVDLGDDRGQRGHERAGDRRGRGAGRTTHTGRSCEQVGILCGGSLRALLTFPWVVIMLLPGLAGVGRVRRG